MDGLNPAEGVYDMTFSLYDADVDGTSVGTYTNMAVAVINGLYEFQLPFTPSELNFTNCWIEIAAKPAGDLNDRTLLNPRSLLVNVPYASKAAQASGVTPGSIGTESLQPGAVTADQLGLSSVTLEKINTYGAADGQTMVLRGSEMVWESLAYWSLLGNDGTVPGVEFIGTSDNQPLEFRVNNQTALRLIPNANGLSVVLGGTNNVVGPGLFGAVVGGGVNNAVDANTGTIGGGAGNTAGASGATVGGGTFNVASGGASFVGGGSGNASEALLSVVVGGGGNTASGSSSAVVGGAVNSATGGRSFVGSGQNNTAGGSFAAVVGGQNNMAVGGSTFVGGGASNRALTDTGVIVGGVSNLNQSVGGFIGSGTGNEVRGSQTFIGAGRDNFARASGSFIGGGLGNEATGDYSSVPGGIFNRAAGFGSTAMGSRAEALHNGAFVYADDSGAAFTSTGDDQFLIRAGGGVGIGTSDPQAALDVVGDIRTSGALTFGDGTVQQTAAFEGWSYSNNTFQVEQALPLNFAISDQVVMRLIPNANGLSVVLGGTNNVVGPGLFGAVVGGGVNNAVDANTGTIGGGAGNTAGASGATVGGGTFNVASGGASFVGGGSGNASEALLSVVVGGGGNTASGSSSAVVGGAVNSATGGRSFVGSGQNNTAGGSFAAVVGGQNNMAVGGSTFVGGGASNRALTDTGVIVGGVSNLNQSVGGFIGSGTGNEVRGSQTFIGAGRDNFARASGSFIGGGLGNEATGDYSSVPGGIFNRAAGFGSTAMGSRAEALHNGAFVYADDSGAAFTSTGDDQFLIRAGGGVGIGTSDPQAALDVVGDIRTSGALTFGDGTVQSSAAFNGWSFTNNVFSSDSTAPLEFNMGGQEVFRMSLNDGGVNIVGASNRVTHGAQGVVVMGGQGNLIDRSNGVIGGGQDNLVGGQWGTVVGGRGNSVEEVFGFVGGGSLNHATGAMGTVSGGELNRAEGHHSVVGGGQSSIAFGQYSTIGGGLRNVAAADGAVVGGGKNNISQEAHATVAGGFGNEALGQFSFIGGGGLNSAAEFATTIGGGFMNEATGDAATVGGGADNIASNAYATVAGGFRNRAEGIGSFAAGRSASALHNGSFVWSADPTVTAESTGDNQFLIDAHGGVGIGTNAPAAALHVNGSAKVNSLQIGDVAPAGYVLTTDASGNGSWQSPVAGAGGWAVNGNAGVQASNYLGTSDATTLKLGVNGVPAFQLIPTPVSPNILAGHPGNTVSETAVGAIVAGGGGETGSNSVGSDFATVSGGAGNRASGMFATVPGGYGNTAKGLASFAAGNRAQANHKGSLLLADSSDQDFASVANNEFAVRATGGARIVSGSIGSSYLTGVRLAPGSGSWSTLSDRNAKENVIPVNSRDVLARVAALPMNTWNYRSQHASVRHVGPMAQDFAAAFGVGENDTSISGVDADGVALAAIQGLNEVVREKDAEIQSLKDRLADLEAVVQQLAERFTPQTALK